MASTRECIFRCLSKSLFRVKPFPQMSHTCDRSPLCVFICLVKFFLCVNALLHNSQTCEGKKNYENTLKYTTELKKYSLLNITYKLRGRLHSWHVGNSFISGSLRPRVKLQGERRKLLQGVYIQVSGDFSRSPRLLIDFRGSQKNL